MFSIKAEALGKGPCFWALLCLWFMLPMDIDLLGLAGDLNRADRYGLAILIAREASPRYLCFTEHIMFQGSRLAGKAGHHPEEKGNDTISNASRTFHENRIRWRLRYLYDDFV